ncbi:MAG: N-acetylmuramoyl-L-alanine amidase [Deltaproteobacteria bacterium]
MIALTAVLTPIRVLFFITAVCCVIFLGVSALRAETKSTPEDDYRKAKAAYDRIAGDANLKGHRRQWINVIQGFRGVYLRYPDHAEFAPKALYMMGRSYLQLYNQTHSRDDLDEAIKRFELVPEKFPESFLADDSLYVLGCLYEGIGEKTWAREMWDEIVESYPQGDHYQKAMMKIASSKGGEDRQEGSPAEAARKIDIDGIQVSVSVPEQTRNGKKGRARIRGIRHWSVEDYTRVVIEASAPLSVKKGELPADKARNWPARMYLDLSPAVKGEEVGPGIALEKGLLEGVRVAQFDPDTVRVVFDLGTTQNIKVFNLDDPYRVVVDAFAPGYVKGFSCPPPPAEETKEISIRIPRKGEKLTLAQQLGLCVRRIVIDPGHGGKDPGAIGPSGLKEKDVALSLSRKVAKELRDKLGCDVILTRDRDVFLPLEERTAIANAKKADLFVSIHTNAAPNPDARGIETYFLNFAVDEDAMRVAALENATSKKRIGELQGILNDILKNSKVSESSRLAGAVQKALIEEVKGKYASVKDLGVKQAPFFVLVGAQMPSILVETSFISNETEERRLRDEAYLASLAEGIADGIISYASGMNLSSLQAPR